MPLLTHIEGIAVLAPKPLAAALWFLSRNGKLSPSGAIHPVNPKLFREIHCL